MKLIGLLLILSLVLNGFDKNCTKEQGIDELYIIEEIKQRIREVKSQIDTDTQDKFNNLMNANKGNAKKLKKFQAKYPKMFNNWLDTLKKD